MGINMDTFSHKENLESNEKSQNIEEQHPHSDDEFKVPDPKILVNPSKAPKNLERPSSLPENFFDNQDEESEVLNEIEQIKEESDPNSSEDQKEESKKIDISPPSEQSEEERYESLLVERIDEVLNSKQKLDTIKQGKNLKRETPEKGISSVVEDAVMRKRKKLKKLLLLFEDKKMRIYFLYFCLLYTSPSPRDLSTSRMPSSA
eukprot:TRINITY_DN9012_c0_g1_i1.p1 TRINITY_DN9012_c0_g1~~TRINITY_DN9012_c0_g1_i1.p1  ORF type:complete len:204 (+),score=52.69 TRINITY_DN9012_c0_g1_i1:186-797(+)